MTELDITIEENCYKAKFLGLTWRFPAGSKENEKALLLFLRGFKKNETSPRGLFSMEQLAQAIPGFEGQSRQSIHSHEKHFEECNYNIKDFLNRKKKVDEKVVDAVHKEVLKNPLFESYSDLTEPVRQELKRDDINDRNIRSAVEHLSYGQVRKSLRKQFEKGDICYKEKALLEEMKSILPDSEKLKMLNLKETGSSEMTISDPTAIKKLLIPGICTKDIDNSLKWVIFFMLQSYYGVPLSVLGSWFNVHKVTVLRWILGLTAAIWPIIYDWLMDGVKPYTLYIDEKWIKIRKKWHYWFVVLDEGTEIPLFSYLSESRSSSVCEWLGIKLKALKKIPKVIITDGLAGYAHLLPECKHLLCLFHHQQSVSTWLKVHFRDDKEREKRKFLMKKIFQTKDKRTVIARFERLKASSVALGIKEWIEALEQKLEKLLPAVGSRKIPNTTNAIERFFRRFNRYYKTRGGFTSVASARKQLIFYQIMYLFIRQVETGMAPIEKILPEAREMPLYKLLNDPVHEILGRANVKLKCNSTDFQEDWLLVA